MIYVMTMRLTMAELPMMTGGIDGTSCGVVCVVVEVSTSDVNTTHEDGHVLVSRHEIDIA